VRVKEETESLAVRAALPPSFCQSSIYWARFNIPLSFILSLQGRGFKGSLSLDGRGLGKGGPPLSPLYLARDVRVKETAQGLAVRAALPPSFLCHHP